MTTPTRRAGQPVDLRKGVEDDHVAPGHGIGGRIRIVRTGHELVIHLVGNQGHIAGQALVKPVHIVPGNDGTGRIVGIAQADQARPRRHRLQDRADSDTEILGIQGYVDNLRALPSGGPLVYVERRPAHDDFVAGRQEDPGNEIQGFGTAVGREQVRRRQALAVERREVYSQRLIVPGRIEAQAGQVGPDPVHHLRGRTERVLVVMQSIGCM